MPLSSLGDERCLCAPEVLSNLFLERLVKDEYSRIVKQLEKPCIIFVLPVCPHFCQSARDRLDLRQGWDDLSLEKQVKSRFVVQLSDAVLLVATKDRQSPGNDSHVSNVTLWILIDVVVSRKRSQRHAMTIYWYLVEALNPGSIQLDVLPKLGAGSLITCISRRALCVAK